MIKEELELLNWQVRTVRRARVEYPVPRVWTYYDLIQRDAGDMLRMPMRPWFDLATPATYAGNPLRFNWGLLGDGFIGAFE